MNPKFLIETYATEREKVLGVWSMFQDEDIATRPHSSDIRGRSVQEQMVHQCVSENLWFMNMLGIDVEAPPLPVEETRLGFIQRYAEDSAKRLDRSIFRLAVQGPVNDTRFEFFATRFGVTTFVSTIKTSQSFISKMSFQKPDRIYTTTDLSS